MLYLMKQKSKPIQSQKKRKIQPLLGTFQAYKRQVEDDTFRMSQETDIARMSK